MRSTWSDRPLIAYVHIAKTAGTTLTGILRRSFATRHLDARVIHNRRPITASQLGRALLVYPRLESIAGHAVRIHTDLKAGFPNIRFYAFLRDPRRRLVSSFLFDGRVRIRRRGRRPTTDREIETQFLGFIDRVRDRYCDVLAPRGGGAEVAIETLETEIDFVGLVENFDESLALLRNWIAKPDFDPRYRRMNVSARRRTTTRRKHLQVEACIERLMAATKAVAARPDVAERIAVAHADEIAVFDHVRTVTFERMRRIYSAGPGPFAFEDDSMATDALSGRVRRDLVARPLMPLLARYGR